jgi:hypothetical protein
MKYRYTGLYFVTPWGPWLWPELWHFHTPHVHYLSVYFWFWELSFEQRVTP